ncbi:MAG TPA: radical SAM protein [Candidatus Bathyarchaeota archaeon]|nr:MAG: radical SAM protein [Candidatus Bathyarchaeota archaeon]RLI29779.1 MAG: radical SAM protein [Candidatus Bathyarchaeota archaeon]HDI06886.1 radical SAM protein [Candidatus Bathyarchaeota archaeon]
MRVPRSVFEVSPPIPLVGCIAFGLIDRGTNVIQVRPTSLCVLSCVFCSTNAGPKSKIRQTEYTVPLDYLIEEMDKIVEYKGRHGIEAHIDTVGDPFTYPHLAELVHQLNQIKGVETVSLQTHGALFNEKILDELSSAGLTRINLSIDALNPELARRLTDTDWYDVTRVMKLAEYIVENTRIDLLVAPVWVPGWNDEEIPKIIRWTIDLGAGKRFPPLGIQKYEVHKHGRKPKGMRYVSWRDFRRKLEEWENLFQTKLRLNREDFGIHKRQMLPIPYRRFETIRVKTVAPGWLKHEKLAVAPNNDRAITLVNAEHIPIGSKIKARILTNKHNIYLAEPLV